MISFSTLLLSYALLPASILAGGGVASSKPDTNTPRKRQATTPTPTLTYSIVNGISSSSDSWGSCLQYTGTTDFSIENIKANTNYLKCWDRINRPGVDFVPCTLAMVTSGQLNKTIQWTLNGNNGIYQLSPALNLGLCLQGNPSGQMLTVATCSSTNNFQKFQVINQVSNPDANALFQKAPTLEYAVQAINYGTRRGYTAGNQASAATEDDCHFSRYTHDTNSATIKIQTWFAFNPTFGGCELNPPLLQCPSGKKLVLATIQYGRWDNTICPHPSVSSQTAKVIGTFGLPSRCVGQQSCQLGGLNNELGDNYPGVYKHYTVSFKCQ